MYTNMIRKGAAIASGLALASAGLIAAPAQATATGLLWSAYGQTNDMVGVSGHAFTLQIGSPTGVAAADPDGADAAADLAAQETELAGQVDITVVPAAGKTAPTVVETIDATAGFATPAANANLQVVLETDGDAGGAAIVATSRLALVAPTGLDYSLQVDVQITYDDGSRSEVERVTFVPQKSVSTSVALDPVAVTETARGGSFSFNGINTGNFVTSNFALAADLPADDADMVANEIAPQVRVNGTNDGAGVQVTNGTYDPITDVYPFTYARTIAAEDVIRANVVINGAVDNAAPPIANLFFNPDSTVTGEAKFTVAATDANADLEISVSNTGVVHNSTTADTSFVDAETVVAPEGTKSLNFVISALTGATPVAAGANIPITVTLSDEVAPANGLGTTTITSNGKSLDVSGTTVSFTLLTNSAGQVAFTVTADNAKAGESFDIAAVNSIGDSIDTTTVQYAKSAMTALPAVDGDFTIAPGDSLSLDYTVIDQFGTPADSDYQLVFTRARASGDRDTAAEQANWSYVTPISADGTASVTIVDNGAADVEGVDTVTATVQQKASSGSGFVAATGATNDTFTLTYENDLAGMTATAKADYDGIANAAGDVIHPLKLETATLVNYDSRIGGKKPKYVTPGDADADGQRGNVPDVVLATAYAVDANVARVFGEVKTSGGVGIEGVAVRLSADGMNFSDLEALGNATRLSNDSVVVFTDATGSYETFIRSGVPGVQTITVDAQGTTATKDVRFQATTGAADALELSVESSVSPGARADIVATVTDSRGAPVSGVTVNFTDNGPGVLNAANAVTDIFGEARVTLTTLKTESGTTSIRAFYQVAGLTEIATATINVGVASSSADAKVNAGSFKGYVAVYALGYEGQRLSAKIGNDWVIVDPIVNNQSANLARVTDFTGAGVDIAVRIYIDRVLVDTIPLTTK